jgi:hypothetical protein
MNNISVEDYIKLLEQLTNEEDFGGDDDLTDNFNADPWIWADSPAKEKMMKSRNASSGILDVTKYKKDQILDALYKASAIKCDEFTIKIEAYHGRPSKTNNSDDLTMDIVVWEKKYKTPSGNPCNMDFKKDFFKDNRFTKRPWLSYFNSNGSADDVPAKTVVEIVRWMQGIKRMTAFL